MDVQICGWGNNFSRSSNLSTSPQINNKLNDTRQIYKHDRLKQQIKLAQYETTKKQNLQSIKDSLKLFLNPQLNKSIDESAFFQKSQANAISKEINLKQAQHDAFAVKLAKDSEETTFHPKLSKYAHDKYKNRVRTGTQIYESCILWQKDKIQINEMRKEQLLQASNVVPISQIYKKYQTVSTEVEFFTRQILNEERKKAKLEKIKKYLTPSFRPKINIKSLNMQSSMSKKSIYQHKEPTVFDNLRKIKDKENIQLSVVETRQTSPIKLKYQKDSSNSILSNIELQMTKTNLPIKFSPISRAQSISHINRRKKNESLAFLSFKQDSYQSNQNFKENNENNQDTVIQEEIGLIQLNIANKMDQEQKSINQIAEFDQFNLLSELMYDYLASDFDYN